MNIMSKERKDYSKLLIERQYDPNKPAPTEQIIFYIEQKNIGTLQNFVTLTGLQKSGKTTFLSAMIAAAITNRETLGMRIRLPEDKRKVCYWDTEQGDFDFHRTMERIKMFTGAERLPPWFTAYSLREDGPADIIWMIKK